MIPRPGPITLLGPSIRSPYDSPKNRDWCRAAAFATIAHHYGWRYDDRERMGSGTPAGHLLECRPALERAAEAVAQGRTAVVNVVTDGRARSSMQAFTTYLT